MGLFSPVPPERFAELARSALAEAGSEHRFECDHESFRLVASEPDRRIFNLHNYYAMYCQTPFWKRRAFLRRWAATHIEEQRQRQELDALGFAEVGARLMPGVRDRCTLALIGLRQSVDGQEELRIARRPFGPRLVEILLVDFEESMSLVSEEMLDGWGVSFEEAAEAARANLVERTEGGFLELAPGIYGSGWGDEYDASRALVPDLLRGLDLEGDPVVFFPNRNRILLVGSEAPPESIAVVCQQAEQLYQPPSMLCAAPMIRRWPDWDLFELSESHPAFLAWKRLSLLDAASVYEDQKAALDALHETRGEDLFVASLTVARNGSDGEEQELFSYCVWADGVVGLLPRADRVAFVKDAGLKVVAPWDLVLEVAGDLMERDSDLQPERFRVRRFPSGELLEALVARSPQLGAAGQ